MLFTDVLSIGMLCQFDSRVIEFDEIFSSFLSLSLSYRIRYHKFLLWLGVPPHRISESRPNEFCRILSEFALEYRTTRERVHQQIEKKATHRERNKTRGKLIIDVAKFKNGNVSNVSNKEESSKDAELR